MELLETPQPQSARTRSIPTFAHDAMEKAARVHSLFDLTLSDIVMEACRRKQGVSKWRLKRIRRFERMTEQARKTMLASNNGPSDPSLHRAYAMKMLIEQEFTKVLSSQGLYGTIIDTTNVIKLMDEHERDVAVILGVDPQDPDILAIIRTLHPHIDAATGAKAH